MRCQRSSKTAVKEPRKLDNRPDDHGEDSDVDNRLKKFTAGREKISTRYFV